MLHALRDQLLRMQASDQQLRAELAASGSLHDGYHPRMAQVHRDNAQALREVISRHGWPTELMVGADAAEAAWLVAQHAIAEPDFMRHCRALLDEASTAGQVPRWQFAYLDDRIRVSEGGLQRFGTQVDLRPDGAFAHALEDAGQVDTWRQQVGLQPLARHLQAASAGPRPTAAAYAARQAAEQAWRRQVGWA